MGKCYDERSNGKLSDEPLNRGVFLTLTEAKVLIGQWRAHYNTRKLRGFARRHHRETADARGH